jgi:hypothetical protein
VAGDVIIADGVTWAVSSWAWDRVFARVRNEVPVDSVLGDKLRDAFEGSMIALVDVRKLSDEDIRQLQRAVAKVATEFRAEIQSEAPDNEQRFLVRVEELATMLQSLELE